MAGNVGTLGGSATIEFHCRDTIREVERVWNPDWPKFPKSRYFVSLERLGLQHLSSQIDRYDLSDNGRDIIISYRRRESLDPRDYAETDNVDRGHAVFRGLRDITGIPNFSFTFSDIILMQALRQKHNTFKEMVSDWSPDELRHKGFSLNKEMPTSMTIMHELAHSLAHPDHLGPHITPNSWRGVKSGADHAQRAEMVENPETLAYLAFALSIPWLKWWGNNPRDSGDGIPIWNTYRDNGQNKFSVPRGIIGSDWFVRIGDYGGREFNTQVERGPYAWA